MIYRRLNLILYRVGFCGHFLQYLFGLDTGVYSLCGGLNRELFYSFRDIRHRYGSWHNHHQYHHRRFGYDSQQARAFLTETNHPLAVISMHPYEAVHIVQPLILSCPTVDVHYYQVSASRELQSVVVDQFASSFNDPRLPTEPDYIDPAEQVRCFALCQEFQPQTTINLDLIVDPMTFYGEYVRIAESMRVPVLDPSTVEDYYHTWRRERFQGLSI